MNESDLQAKGYVQAPDGSWAKPRVGKPVLSVPFYTPKVNPSKRIRQSRDKMNKLELEYYGLLNSSMAFAFPEKNHITAQSLRFKLGNGVWYKPDFVVFATEGVFAYEVKGPHAFRGGFESLKVAAGLYPWIKWSLVWKEGYQWQEQEVLP